MSRGTGLQVASFGPFTKGVVDSYNPSLNTTGALRRARHAILTGAGQLRVRAATQTIAGPFLNDAGTPAACTTVCAVAEFGTGVVVIAHSPATSTTYLYHDPAGFSTGSVAPTGVLWTGQASAPTVTVAEILGTLYVACAEALDTAGLYFATRTFDGTTLDTLAADLDGTGPQAVYARGVAAFQTHLVTWGYDQGSDPAVASRPEYLRLGGPNGDPLDSPGKAAFGVGHRIHSPREQILSACVVGEVCYLGTPTGVWALTGYGRDTWQLTSLDAQNGVVGPHAMVAANGAAYLWAPRGPMRVSGLTAPDPLWDAVAETADAVNDTGTTSVVAAYDPACDQVQFHYYGPDDAAGSVRRRAAFDVRRQAWLGPDSDHVATLTAAAVVTELPPFTRARAVVGVRTTDGVALVQRTDGLGEFDESGGTGTLVALEVDTWDATPAEPQGACVWRQITLVHRCEGAVTWAVTPTIDGVALPTQTFARTTPGTYAEEYYVPGDQARGQRLAVHAAITARASAAVELIDLAHHYRVLSVDP
jgi:hypothetical protein